MQCLGVVELKRQYWLYRLGRVHKQGMCQPAEGDYGMFFLKKKDIFIYLLSLFIYLFLAVLSLRCCTQAFSSWDERGLLFIAVHRLLIAVASVVVEHGL